MKKTGEFTLDDPILRSMRRNIDMYQKLVDGVGLPTSMTASERHRLLNHYKTILASYVPILMEIIVAYDQAEAERLATEREAFRTNVAHRYGFSDKNMGKKADDTAAQSPPDAGFGGEWIET